MTDPNGLTSEQQRQLANLNDLVRAGLFAADRYSFHPEVTAAPGAVKVRVAVTAAIGLLIDHGIITVTPESDWPDYIAPHEVAEHLRPDIPKIMGANRALRNTLYPNGLPS